jgi:hypothetical protein
LSKPFLFPGVSGIYSINCSENNKTYIGKSRNLGNRIGAHLFKLHNGDHANRALQQDYNRFGFSKFSFSILEFVDRENLTSRESFWIQSYKKGSLYNAMPVYDQSDVPDIDAFIKYINSRWLAPAGVDYKKPNEYRIVEDYDREDIVATAHRCKLFDLFRSELTFLRVAKFLESDLGYTVITRRAQISDDKRTYKIITAFDPNKIKPSEQLRQPVA